MKRGEVLEGEKETISLGLPSHQNWASVKNIRAILESWRGSWKGKQREKTKLSPKGKKKKEEYFLQEGNELAADSVA